MTLPQTPSLALSLAASFRQNRVETNKLKLAAQRYSAVADICPIPTFITDINGSCIYVNAAYLKLVDASFQEMMGDGWLKSIHPEDQQRVAGLWMDSVRRKRSYRHRHRIRRPDDKLVRVCVYACELPCEAWVGYAVPATLMQDEEGFLVMESENELFFESSPDLLCIADEEGFFLKVNPSWERILGYHPSELVSQRYLDFVHPDDIEQTKLVAESLKHGAGSRFRNRYRHKDGSYRLLSWVSSSYMNGLTYAVARDVTTSDASPRFSASAV